ncbi:unnamed protein product [Strongylus vulgaris]|uniref:Uncharacterized protein n=1 Tax=Strongylus vulgaris TaxID=40348 RepID=A0A3P7IP31_STRVU|nr:unnamed protein product [Strongylus vulgaris]
MGYRCLIFFSSVISICSLTLLGGALLYGHYAIRQFALKNLRECEIRVHYSPFGTARNRTARKPRYSSYNAAVPRSYDREAEDGYQVSKILASPLRSPLPV